MTEVMLDLETLGTSPSSVILSIGAVVFDLQSGAINRVDGFYRRIDWDTDGRTVDADTIRWWMKQSDAARQEVTRSGTTLYDALILLSGWFPAGGTVWSNGATFDVVIMEHAFNQMKVHIPWKFWDIRDVRTIKDLSARVALEPDTVRIGTAHNAFDDAVYQATYVCEMWRNLSGVTRE
jgi:hypothetical protein